MDMSNMATKKQKHLLGKYKVKYGKDYLNGYLQEKYPEASVQKLDDMKKEEAQYIITGRKKHERHIKGLDQVNDVNLTHLQVKEFLQMNFDMAHKDTTVLVERYNEESSFVLGTRYEIKENWIHIYMEDEMVSSFREEDVKSVLLTQKGPHAGSLFFYCKKEDSFEIIILQVPLLKITKK